MLEQHLLRWIEVSVFDDVARHCAQDLQLVNSSPVWRAVLAMLITTKHIEVSIGASCVH